MKQDTNQDCKIVENQFTINPTQLSINVKFEMFNWNNSSHLTLQLYILAEKYKYTQINQQRRIFPLLVACCHYSNFLSLTFFFFHPPNDKSKFRQHYNLRTDNVGNFWSHQATSHNYLRKTVYNEYNGWIKETHPVSLLQLDSLRPMVKFKIIIIFIFLKFIF